MSKKVNGRKYIGKNINNLLILDFFVDGRSKFLVKCHCGKKFSTRYDYVLKGNTKSCGCSKSNHLKNRNRKYNYKKLPNGVAAFNILFSRYKKGANDRGLDFNISKIEFKNIVTQNCTYCGVGPIQEIISTENTGIFYYNGIDRVDGTLGYVEGNCVPCCKRCNFFKHSMDGQEFIELVSHIAKNNKLTNRFKEHKLQNYHDRALSIAKNSPDAQTKVGAILIHKNSGAVIADGYNGFCRKVNDDKLPNTRPEKYDYIIHAEMNLLCNCARHGISTNECVLYCTLSPCINCLRSVYQSGITTIYFKEKYRDFDKNLNMKDLNIHLYELYNRFYRIELEPKRC